MKMTKTFKEILLEENSENLEDLDESQKPEKMIKDAMDIQKEIDQLLSKAPKGGFNDPEQEKIFWSIINSLYKQLEKVVKK